VINAVTGKVESAENQLAGKPTLQELSAGDTSFTP
jgi:hypothetical protein